MSRQHVKLNRRRWEWTRRKVLRRDGWRCRSCRKYGNEADHIQPLHRGGAEYDMGNLQCLCRSCHIEKTRGEWSGPRDPAREAWAALVRELTT